MDAVEAVKERLNIEDVVAEYVELKRSGRNFKGLSPWTAEKSPSFMVSPEKQIWHDFSSGKGGGMFNFVMEMEGVDFKGALEILARKAGIDLDQYRTSRGSNSDLKKRLGEALEWAAKFYQAQLSSSQLAVEYIFKKREFTKETLLAFRIGYSPNTGSALVQFLRKKGYTDEEIKKAGLGTQRRSGFSDMFRERIMIPLMDPQGLVVGFTARQLIADQDAPKYINTPQTLLYDKGRHVYGLHLAKEAIRKNNFVVVVEGNLDVVSSWQAGVRNVVATAGTAMTESHLKALGRFTPDVRLSFDQDAAGLAAAERVIPLGQKSEVQLSIITIPEGKDPDELVKKDPQLWQQAIEKPQYVIDWLIDRYRDKLDLSSATGKREFTDVVLATVRRLQDSVEQDHYIKKIAEIADISEIALRTKLTNGKADLVHRRTMKAAPTVLDHAIIEANKHIDHLLSLSLHYPAWRTEIQEVPETLMTANQKKVAAYLQEQPEEKDAKRIIKSLQDIADYVKILLLQYEELYNHLDAVDAREAYDVLRRRIIQRYVEIEKQRLSDQIAVATGQTLAELMAKDKSLNELLRKYKEQ